MVPAQKVALAKLREIDALEATSKVAEVLHNSVQQLVPEQNWQKTGISHQNQSVGRMARAMFWRVSTQMHHLVIIQSYMTTFTYRLQSQKEKKGDRDYEQRIDANP